MIGRGKASDHSELFDFVSGGFRLDIATQETATTTSLEKAFGHRTGGTVGG